MNLPRISDSAVAEVTRVTEANRELNKNTVAVKDFVIDEIDARFVQSLITAIHYSPLKDEEKENIQTTLLRWQKALMLSDKPLLVTF